VAGHPVLRPVLLFWAVTGVVGAPLVAAVTFLVTHDRGLPTSDFGLVISGYSVGNLAGALISARIIRGALGRLMIGGEVLVGLAVAGLGAGLPVPVLAALAFVAGVAGAVVAIAYITIRAAVTPNELLGRVGSTARTLSIGLQPLGLLAGGIVLDTAGGAALLAWMGGLLVLLALAFGLSRAFRGAQAVPHPDGPPWDEAPAPDRG
jgi:MFS family permease